MSYIIGLTGGLASGKSTVAAMFKEFGAKVLNADAIAHQHIQRGGICFQAVVDLLGKDVLVGGCINRKKVGSIVFKDLQKLNQLEKIIHPVVRRTIKEEIQKYKQQKRDQIIILDVPLLFESGGYSMIELSIVVMATQQRQIQRAINGLKITRVQAMRRIKAQMSLQEKCRLVDIKINNNGTIEQTKNQVEEIWKELLLGKEM